MSIIPLRVYIGTLVFGAVFGISLAEYMWGRAGISTILPFPLSFFVMIGSGILLLVSLVGLWEVRKK